MIYIKEYLSILIQWMDVLILILLVGHANGWKDLSSKNWFLNYPEYMNKGLGSWRKWKKNPHGASCNIPINEAPWYYLKLFKPEYKERFWYSSTALVFITDFWHLAQFIQFQLVFTAICLSSIKTINLNVYQLLFTIFITLPCVFGIGFYSGYGLMQRIRKITKGY